MRKKFGNLPPKYNYSLNPYPDFRFTKCPDCDSKTSQRKCHIVLFIDPLSLITLNYTHRYCKPCNMLIGHKHEIEHHLTELFKVTKPEIIGNPYMIVGSIERTALSSSIPQKNSFENIQKNQSDFKSYQEIRMLASGWILDDAEQPEIQPPKSTEWVRKS